MQRLSNHEISLLLDEQMGEESARAVEALLERNRKLKNLERAARPAPADSPQLQS